MYYKFTSELEKLSIAFAEKNEEEKKKLRRKKEMKVVYIIKLMHLKFTPFCLYYR